MPGKEYLTQKKRIFLMPPYSSILLLLIPNQEPEMTKASSSLIILIVSSLFIQTVSAQKYNSFIGIRFGAALPMGEFASHEYGYGGYALLGTSFGGEAAWFITPKLGFGVDVSMNSFNYANGYYAEDYKESDPAFSKVEMLSGPYKLRTYMGGVYYKTTISPKLHSTFKLMGGLFNARTPDQFFGVTAAMVGNLNFWKTSSKDSKFSFLTGASIEYKLYDKVSLLLQADFTYAQAAFIFKTASNTSYTDYLRMPVFRMQPGINIHF